MVLDGFLYGLALLLLAGFAAYLGGPAWAVPELLLAAFVFYFFRDPDRTPPSGEWVVSPADGRVVDVKETVDQGQPIWKISIFLSIFNVHVNRSPIAGVIQQVTYTPGKFLVASREKASFENEQNTVVVRGDHCTVTFKQIAGLIARRIVFNKKVGDRVACGERVGLIKFGSRVDVFLPAGLQPKVGIGDRVRGGTSVLASLQPSKGSPASRDLDHSTAGTR